VILVDTGPLIALFDPQDRVHARCVNTLNSFDEALSTTLPVLTEAFHLLTPDSVGAQRLMEFIEDAGMAVWHLDDADLTRAFELMHRYANVPMDFADATLVAAAEASRERKVFTIDRKDFAVYRIRRGHRHVPFEVIDPGVR
jgi:predicted nucleic acid-binding protein